MAAIVLPLRDAGGATLLAVRLVPDAGKAGLRGCNEWRGALSVAVSEPASRGRANAALLTLLEHELGLEAGSAELVRGHHSRSKQVRLPLTRDEAAERLAEALR